MRPYLMQAYSSIGTVFGLIRAVPELYDVFAGHPVPNDSAETRDMLIAVLIAIVHGLLRAIAWLPSIVYKVGMHHEPLRSWLFSGWW
jgi:hypothetical protein